MIKLINGAEVFSALGEKVGVLDRVVIDPATKEVSHIIVKEGIIFSNSKVIPISFVNLDGERITLTKTDRELEKTPDFDENMYVSTEEKAKLNENAQALYLYPPVRLGGWNTSDRVWNPAPKYVAKREKILPEGMIALEEGAQVVSNDEENMGEIEQIIVESQIESPHERATHFVVSQGLFSKEHKLIPTFWITNVMDDEVHLSINSEVLEKLPEHEPTA